MNDSYIVLSNNPKVNELIITRTDYRIIFVEGTVTEVIRKCEELFIAGKYKLAADPLAGRNARPFPYLTIILEKSTSGAETYDWNRLADYSTLHSRRIEDTLACSERIKNDYQVLDWSFTKAALKL